MYQENKLGFYRFCRLSLGVEMGGGCGETSIRFRPSLTFSSLHANILLDFMDKVASEMLVKM